MKNYFGFAMDGSTSMNSLRSAAMNDFNACISAIKEASTRETQDTIVSTNRFATYVTREILISNPHVLKPMTSWPANGNTALYDAIGDMIDLHETLPDASRPEVSFVIFATTDGEENNSRRWTSDKLASKIRALQATGRWTFVLRVPRGQTWRVTNLGVPAGNIQEWDTTEAGMRASTVATKEAMNNFYTGRAAGQTSSGTFYANANVSAKQVQAKLVDISAEVSLWSVLSTEHKNEIKPFCERRLGKTPFLKGAAFYQLTKLEARVGPEKLFIVRDKNTGHVYQGAAARQMIGIQTTGYARVHPAQHGNYEIFIQSTSINRHLMAGTVVLYWPNVGVAFQPADTAYLNRAPAAPVVPATVAVAKKPVVKTPATSSATKRFFPTREAARKLGFVPKDSGVNAPKGERWFVYK